MSVRTLAVAVALSLAACSGTTSDKPDGAASPAGLDAASQPTDASTAQPGADAATAVDSGTTEPPDAAAAAGPDAAAAPGPDAGPSYPACAASYASCAGYTDATAPAADRTISFTCCQYTPKCLKIAAGQSVTFSGSFGSHPLDQACGPAQVIVGASAGNATFQFDLPGEYGFYCAIHGTAGGGGMAGSILVE
jgi:plastocyanin